MGLLFKKKKKKKQDIGGFFKDKLFGDFSFADAKKRIGPYFKSKFSEISDILKNSRGKLKDIPGTNYELGLYHMQKGNLTDAIMRFKMVCRFRKDHVEARYNLARCYMFKGDDKDAKEALNEVLKLEPNKTEAKYLLKKIDTPEKIDSMPLEILKEVVDLRASFYEQDYIDNGYLGSKSLINETFKKVQDKNPNFDVLDLGCGIGQCGYVLKQRALAKTITGVDLSKQMIEYSSELEVDNIKVYDSLHKQEITEFLKSDKSKYDLVLSDLATDFLGDLEPLANSIKRVLSSGGYFSAIIRKDDLKEGYKLNVDYEDFTHSHKYFVDTFKKVGFKLESSKETDIVGDTKGEILIFKL